MNLKYFLSIIALSIFSIAAFADDAQSQLNSLLSNFHSMSADFKQKTIVKKGLGKSSTGLMALERPGKFRWEITQPNRQVIIADGKNLWIYDVDLEQATKKSLTKDVNSPAILLSGSTSAIEKRFTMIKFGQQGNKIYFQLKPKQNHDMFQSVELEFQDKKLQKMSIIDNLGSKTIFHFSNIEINPALPQKLFSFHAPKSVDILAE